MGGPGSGRKKGSGGKSVKSNPKKVMSEDEVWEARMVKRRKDAMNHLPSRRPKKHKSGMPSSSSFGSGKIGR